MQKKIPESTEISTKEPFSQSYSWIMQYVICGIAVKTQEDVWKKYTGLRLECLLCGIGCKEQNMYGIPALRIAEQAIGK